MTAFVLVDREGCKWYFDTEEEMDAVHRDHPIGFFVSSHKLVEEV